MCKYLNNRDGTAFRTQRIYFSWTWTWQKLHYFFVFLFFSVGSPNLLNPWTKLVVLIVVVFLIWNRWRTVTGGDVFEVLIKITVFFFSRINLIKRLWCLEYIIKHNFVCFWCCYVPCTHIWCALGKILMIFSD